ncbi:hypothetical protein [Opitutus terrae]|uniref:Uncharacterized protein n=1 Tax=Opitutus terrae (strain DSM 11246 / JCM 15787 / PB90-1) TaxID=452637 RepID=B1ZMY7_OPITP|nr:hypothetical protein [Opitutus terrae]ACB76439.1 hypothetical protein Oter_3159 [Opitutus terrae PB90-1]
MTPDRFEELVQQLLDGELPTSGGAELAAELQTRPERRRELRQHLVLWELWAQQQAPERSADAFVAGWTTRLRAERQGERFVAEVEQRIRADADLGDSAGCGAESPDPASPRSPHGVFRWWQALQQPAGALWAAVSVVAFAAVVWLAMPGRAIATVTVQGEAVCTSCALHETHEHLPAIRVQADGETTIYYVQSDPAEILRIGDYCMAPVPLVATGRMHTEKGRRLFEAQIVTGTSDKARPRGQAGEPILFPF